MKIFDLASGKSYSSAGRLSKLAERRVFVICTPEELVEIAGHFSFDESTVRECTDYDENIRFTAYADYDFISLIYFTAAQGSLSLHEINVFVGPNFFVLVLPEDEERQHFIKIAQEMEARLMEVKSSGDAPDEVMRLYYYLFDKMLRDFFTTLETLEDELKEIERKVLQSVNEEYFFETYRMKDNIYTLKKILRAFLYIGDQMIVNENNLIPKENIKYFKNLDIRMNKLYDFANSLQESGSQLINLYESRVAMQTNAVVNKLTAYTLLFGPLTVITGVYGMNFVHMPELDLRFGYPAALGLMAVICISLYTMFKLKKWI